MTILFIHLCIYLFIRTHTFITAAHAAFAVEVDFSTLHYSFKYRRQKIDTQTNKQINKQIKKAKQNKSKKTKKENTPNM